MEFFLTLYKTEFQKPTHSSRGILLETFEITHKSSSSCCRHSEGIVWSKLITAIWFLLTSVCRKVKWILHYNIIEFKFDLWSYVFFIASLSFSSVLYQWDQIIQTKTCSTLLLLDPNERKTINFDIKRKQIDRKEYT